MLSFEHCIFGKRGENIKLVKTVEEWDRFGLAMNIESQILTMLSCPASFSSLPAIFSQENPWRYRCRSVVSFNWSICELFISVSVRYPVVWAMPRVIKNTFNFHRCGVSVRKVLFDSDLAPNFLLVVVWDITTLFQVITKMKCFQYKQTKLSLMEMLLWLLV